MKDFFSIYRTLRKDAYRSYWEKRILAEIGYLIELLYHKDGAAKALLEQAVTMLYQDYKENEQINVEVAKKAEEMLLPLSEKAKEITMICAAHAHIDMNWMWGYQETVAITLDTVRTMLTLMNEYPDYTFSQSQASVYHILEEYAPDMLEQVKARVKEGRWEVIASSWVENDKNMSGGEAMARHLLYTKKYLTNLLNIKAEDLNLDFEPDTFGHSYNVPEILNKGGVTRYYHCRGYKGENIYRWRGKSGAEVLAYREPTWYLGYIESDLCEGIAKFCEKYGIDRVLNVYGVGDHGGGPTRRDIERLQDMNAWPLFPTIRFGTYKEFYDYLEERKEQFPVVDQELNYVFTGCYTSQARIKMANHIGENRLAEAEILESMAKLEVPGYQRIKSLEEAWRKQLFNQFHDILPGSGTVETREYAMGEFQKLLAQAGVNAANAMNAMSAKIAGADKADRVADTAAGAGVGFGTDYESGFGFGVTERGNGLLRYLTLFNTTQVERKDPTIITLWDWQEDLNYTRITDAEGNECPFEVLETGETYWFHTYCKLLVWAKVPALGYTVCRVDVKDATDIPVSERTDPRLDDFTDEPICLENDKVKVVFDAPTMKCISFVRKADGKELINAQKPAFGFALVTENITDPKPDFDMTSWRVGQTMQMVDLNETCIVKPDKDKMSGHRKQIGYEMKVDDTVIRVKISLDDGCEFLDYRVETVWTKLGSREKGVPQLRFMVPCGYERETYRYSIPYGFIDRVPFAQDVPTVGIACAVAKDEGSSMYVLSDSKYGFRGDDEGLSVNLIRGSYDPDPYPEIGTHVIRLAVGACDSKEENLALIAEQYFHPVTVRSCNGEPQEAELQKSLFKVDGAILSAIKYAEDGNGFIIRVYNPSNEEKTVKIDIPGREISVSLCDILENNIKQIDHAEYVLKGSEVGSFRVVLK